MEFAVNQAIKVLRGGRSWHGGAHEWSLPTQGADGVWTPGAWTAAVTPSMCSRGWHLTREPALWWGEGADVVGYLAEWDGAHVEREDKVAVERCRLLRPLTRAEIEACGIFTEGAHSVSSGRAWASGSATVEARGSATVEARGSARFHVSGQATATAWSGATLAGTRAEQGVIIDRRGAEPKVYTKRGGLDGWRYRDGAWAQVKVRTKAKVE